MQSMKEVVNTWLKLKDLNNVARYFDAINTSGVFTATHSWRKVAINFICTFSQCQYSKIAMQKAVKIREDPLQRDFDGKCLAESFDDKLVWTSRDFTYL